MQGQGKAIQKRDSEGFRIQEFAKGKYTPAESADDLTELLNLSVEGIKKYHGRGYLPAYPNDIDGFQLFYDRTIAYFDRINQINSKLGENPKARAVFPDVESWAISLGITRQTIFKYQSRGGEWEGFIAYVKEIIISAKKQLASSFRIPPMFAIFDLTNNANYFNTSEFKLIPEKPKDDSDILQRDLDRQIAESGLIWNPATKEYEPRG